MTNLLQTNINQNKSIIHVIRGRPGKNDRPSLPAGHYITWSILIAGTCLENTKYPYPVFYEEWFVSNNPY